MALCHPLFCMVLFSWLFVQRSELRRGEHLVLFENCTEIAAIVVAHLRGYLVDIHAILQQKYLRLLYTLSSQILKGTQVQTFLEKPAQILR